MTLPVQLDSESLRRTMVVYHDALVRHRQRLNELNVYPVPDADTGNNMSMTMRSVVEALDAASIDEVAAAIARGSLLGARGASGVILSQILGAMAPRLDEPHDGVAFASALCAAADAAYEAVPHPVEGTMLTVARAAADGALGIGRAPLPEVLAAAHEAAADALAHTPDLLPALQVAGVVDAGGAGYLLLLEALQHVIAGVPIPTAETPETQPIPDSKPIPGRFEVVVRLAADPEDMAAFRNAFEAVGTEATAIAEGTDGCWVAHTHTDDPDAAISVAETAGRVLEVQVTDLITQVADLSEPERAALRTALLVVADSAELRRLFRRRGATAFVTGGAARKPSTSELLDAVERTAAPEAIIIPNETNVLPAAEQAAALAESGVTVVATRSIPEGLAAAGVFDPTLDAAINARAMRQAAEPVRSGGVTQAIRDASSEAGPVRRGDWLALTPDGLVAVADSQLAAAQLLLDVLITEDAGIVTLIAGADATPRDAAKLERWTAERWPQVEVLVFEGGQPLYPLLVGVSDGSRTK